VEGVGVFLPVLLLSLGISRFLWFSLAYAVSFAVTLCFFMPLLPRCKRACRVGAKANRTLKRYWQVVAVRIDERARKVYGKCKEMYEAAPYMFAPV